MKDSSKTAETTLKSSETGVDGSMYRFAGYALDCTRWQLRWGDEPLGIHRKSFDLLLCLVRAHPRVVTKDEILETVWPGQFVEENNLSQQISLLRKALNRHTDPARLIETIPGRGYRLAAPVQATAPAQSEVVLSAEASITCITVHEETEEDSIAQDRTALASGTGKGLTTATNPSTSATALPSTPPRRGLWIPVALFWAAALAAVGWFGYQRWQSREGGPPVQVVLTPLEGTTGDTTLDNALNNTLRFDLGESPFVTLVSSAVVNSTLHQMRRPATEGLSPGNAREVCERTGSQAFLHAVLARTGQHFLITGEATSCVDGSTLASTKQDAARAEDLPLAFDKLTARLRERLGESRRSVARFSTPAYSADTASLDALKSYYQAGVLQHAGKFAEALEAEKKTISLDPSFALSYYDLSIIESSLYATAESKAAMQRAYDLRGTTDPQTQFVITGGYAQIVTGDIYTTLRNAAVWTEEYPRSALAWNALGSARLQLGDYSGGIMAEQKAAAIRPDIGVLWSTIAQAQLHSGDLASARATSEHGLTVAPNLEGARMTLLRVAFFQHDNDLRQQQLDWITAHPQSPMLETLEAELDVIGGQFAEAERLTDEAALVFQQQGSNSGATSVRKLDTMELIAAGDRADGERRFRSMKLDPDDPNDLMSLALLGESHEAETLLAQRLEKQPASTLLRFYYAPTIRGMDLLTQGHPDQALSALNGEGVLDGVDAQIDYLRGTAYLALHDPSHAALAFHKAVDHPGFDNTYAYSASLLGLARAEAALSRTSSSSAAYDAYKVVMRNADKPAPALITNTR